MENNVSGTTIILGSNTVTECEPKIVKEHRQKNPRRVKQGKKLAEFNKRMKQENKLKKEEEHKNIKKILDENKVLQGRKGVINETLHRIYENGTGYNRRGNKTS